MNTRPTSLYALAPLLMSFSAPAAAVPSKQEVADSLSVCQKAQEAECGHVPYLEQACDKAIGLSLHPEVVSADPGNAQTAKSPH